MSANPPDGAMIDYALPAGIKGPVTLVIRDAANKEVRRFSSTDKHPLPDAAKLEYAPEWVKQKLVPAALPGMHRFVWDLRCGAPPALGEFEGVWAPPGRYTIVLSAGGKTLTQPLTVVPDPRVKLPLSAYVQEFALASKVVQAWSEAKSALADATKRLKSVRQHRDPKSMRLAQRIQDLSGASEDSENVAVKPPLRADSLKTLATDLQSLENAVDGADADPGPDAQASYQKLSLMLANTLREWEKVKKSQLQ
jgi:hypothetical protein